MAAGILFVVAEKLATLLQSEEGLNLSTAYSGIKRMETELRRVQELLEEDPGLEMNHKDLRKWARDLTNAAQNIEDIVDNFVFNLERRQQLMGWMGKPMRTLKDLVTRHKVAAEIKQMKEKMGRIFESMPNKQVFGFDEDLDALVKLLVEGNSPHPLYTFIAGPCGAGKTTLVKEVYDSYAVKKQFPYPFWFRGHAPRFGKHTTFLKELTIKVTMRSQQEVGSIDETKMRRMISDALNGKRYLIVLDINLRYPEDINPREDFISKFMFDIRKAFPDERNGSRVVVTCNDKGDADLFGRAIEQEFNVHELGMLSSEEKWKLFLNTWDFNAATAETTAGTSLSSGMLEEIVRKQMHLPSEIVNLGALLSKENRKSSALSNIMLDHPNYYQVDGPERTLLKIASSFELLESPLKLCFLYCSLFPKGFEIRKRRLIKLWLAEGWLHTEDEWVDFAPGRLRTRSELYVKELSHQGMIQVEYSYLHFAVKRFRLGSPVWDFAAMKAMQYNLSHNIDNEGPPDRRSSSSSNARGLALHSSGIYNHIFHDQKVSLPNLRLLLCFPQLTVIGGEVTFPTSRFRLLRVLDLEDMYFITQLSEEIGELVHLRYLGLRRTGLYSLPNSIGNLKYLQTLDIKGTRVKPIPSAIQKLKRLEFLYMDMDDGSTDDNDSLDVSSLRSLRVLLVIRVGSWMENSVGQLRYLTKLGIYGDPLDYQFAGEVTKLEFLRSLRLGFGFADTISEDIISDSILRQVSSLYLERPLQKLPGPDLFPDNGPIIFPYFLKKLCLKWSLLEQDPMATLERLDYLTVLKLRCGSFLGKKMVCSADGFPWLRFLELSLLDGLEEWTVEKGAMRYLKHLVIRLCNRLKELPQGLRHLHLIHKLEVAGMPDTFNARLQYNKGEDWYKIKYIKSVTVDGIPMGASSSSSSYSSSSFQP